MDMGYVRTKLWNDNGYHSIGDILNEDIDQLINIDRNMPCNGRLGETRLRGVVINAVSWAENRPVNIHGKPFPIKDSYIALDCEYVPIDKDLYLIGYAIVEKGNIVKVIQHFNDNGKWDNINNLIKNTEFDLFMYHDVKGYDIVTYAGNSADVPVFRYHNSSCLNDSIDIFQWLYGNMRFPCAGMGLKPLSSYAGFKYKSGLDGAESLFIWMEYLDTIKKKRYADSMKNKLMKYNKEDLQATVKVIEFVRGL
jgi:predicted RecB family nuclease